MGASESSREAPLELPQQRIVSVVDGHVEAAAGPRGVGSAQEAVAVRAPFALARGGLRLDASGLRAEFSAGAAGALEVLAPALERAGAGAWPSVAAEGQALRRAFGRGRCALHLEGVGESLRAGELLDASVEAVGEGCRRWPAVLIFWPGSPDGAARDDPPDGTLMACCSIRGGQLEVSRQLIAWGGSGAAYVMKELYGIQEVRASASQGGSSAEGDAQRNCVVCLTSTKDTALMPCGHFCVCYECGAALRLAPARNRCPLCRQEVRDITRIDFASAPPDERAPPPAGAPAGEEGAEAGGAGAGLPQRCLQRLTREMRQIEEQRPRHLEEHGLELAPSDPEGGDLRTLSLRILTRGIDKACKLGKELRAHGIDAIEFEVWIPDAFPVKPPRLRVIKPCFHEGSFFVFQHGALCMEILTAQGWTPAMSLPQLGVQVKTVMSQGGGTVAGGGCMGDPGPAGREPAWAVFCRIESTHSDWKVFSVA